MLNKGTTWYHLKRLWDDVVLDWGLNPGPHALEASTLPLGYRGGGGGNNENIVLHYYWVGRWECFFQSGLLFNTFVEEIKVILRQLKFLSGFHISFITGDT